MATQALGILGMAEKTGSSKQLMGGEEAAILIFKGTILGRSKKQVEDVEMGGLGKGTIAHEDPVGGTKEQAVWTKEN